MEYKHFLGMQLGCGALVVIGNILFWGMVILALGKYVFGWSPFS